MTDKIMIDNKMKEYYCNKLRAFTDHIKLISDFNIESCVMTPSIVHDDVSVFKETFLRVDTVLQLILHEFMTINIRGKTIRKIPILGTPLEAILKKELLFQNHENVYTQEKEFCSEFCNFKTYFLKTDREWLSVLHEKEERLFEKMVNFKRTTSYEYHYLQLDHRRCRELITLLESVK